MFIPWQMAARQIWAVWLLGIDANQLVPIDDKHRVLT